ncbi:hypothetical protein SARC_01537 [Sphaeroforma arctica JP610]|uniref:LicD/FKTN/FKRP nucleotidyltransferase domain-containing protein n=1 Tax=Sphaeroforma arctica JP610 TaxID=667725 RepID=A0A0L0GDH9_9EUKA|nr:hypothetical protein SARC_01537 [Sphaeroforma arctica JP610]KNC86313.1 hypothetical protein SARC_01537 [Sphaeroforma arctica JP610]|eukprot:XP_014160215.1 hypothetical protein SARC_01537 [Sphaeroforma arctica JP610]
MVKVKSMGRLYTAASKTRTGRILGVSKRLVWFLGCIVICIIISVTNITGLSGIPIVIETGINPFDLYLFENGNVTDTDYYYLADMLNRTDDALRAIDIPYSISSGSLLGLCRHGGPIPWDDDADIVVPKTDFFTAIEHINATLAPHGYTVLFQAPASKNNRKVKAKLFPTDGTPVKSRTCRLYGEGCYRYPFIDIFVYFEEKGQHEETTIRMSDKELANVPSIHTKETVPVLYHWPGGYTSHTRAFTGAPAIVRAMYGENYDDVCVSRGYSHKLNSLAEKYKTFGLTCQQLRTLKPHIKFSDGSLCSGVAELANDNKY